MGRILRTVVLVALQFRTFSQRCQSRFVQSSPSPLDKIEQCCGVSSLTLAQEDSASCPFMTVLLAVLAALRALGKG
jgi:hypothetical protein